MITNAPTSVYNADVFNSASEKKSKPHHRRTPTGFGKTEIKRVEAGITPVSREIWKKFASGEFVSKEQFQQEFVKHVETTLARSMYNCDRLAAYQATSQAMRDRLLVAWNKTQQEHTLRDPKRIYYFSLEFLMGRALDNALLNVGLKDIVSQGVSDLGFRMEDIIDQEQDAALGNGGLGRLAACFLDSLSSMNFPGWGYGLRYQYGIFKQLIVDGHQVEVPDYWLTFSNPWEIPRNEIQIDIQFYGYVRKSVDQHGNTQHIWEGGEFVQAVAYDVPIPGFNTHNTNNLRLWSSKPTREFDLEKFNAGDYESSVSEQQKAETISAVLYPNDNMYAGKELRLKQQYFWCAASLHDIIRRFKKTGRPWTDFPMQVTIQLNDTHPSLAIIELQRVLVDVEQLQWDKAWDIVVNTFGYTNHTVLPEALEKWSVPLLENLLPRHMEIIYDLNLFFLQSVERKFPKDRELLSRVSIIEESSPQQVRMAYLAVIGSHKVNGVAELHSELICKTIFRDFVRIFGTHKFTNVTNGITPRRWLHQANPQLSKLIAEKLGGYEFLANLDLLKELENYASDSNFQDEWTKVKKNNKIKFAKYIKDSLGLVLDPNALYDIQVKRIHEYKRQQMNIFGVIHRYLRLKRLTEDKRCLEVPRVCIFGGKAAPGYHMAKMIIRLITGVATVINNDTDIGSLLKVVFLEDYNVSKAELVIPASDISQHISTAGTEASGTSNMKFVLNGGLILGTVDGANIELTRELSEENIFLFGNLSDAIDDLRHARRYGKLSMDTDLFMVCNEIQKGTFGDPNMYQSIISSVDPDKDYYIVNDDFASYLTAQRLVDEAYKDKKTWIRKTIIAVARMGFFSSDRAIKEYADTIWNIEPVKVECINKE